MIQRRRKRSLQGLRKLLFLVLTTTAFMIYPVLAQIQYPTVEQNGLSAKPELEEGKVILNGSKGQYTGYVVVKASLPSIWQTLTDYDNFEKYMPNVIESNLLESRGNYRVFEQVQVFRFLLFSRKAKVKIVVTEDYPKLIKFKVIEGEVKKLQGSWQIEPIDSDTYLITHQVSVEPDIESSFNQDLFFTVYEDTIEKTLAVIYQESARRSNGR